MKKQLRLCALSTMGIAVAASPALAGQGPSSSQTPYVVGTGAGASFTSVLTVGDSIGGYQMVGIPDGIGLIDNGDGTVQVLLNHEITKSQSIVRDHGFAGSFVSSWNVTKSNLTVNAGDDLIKNLSLSDIQAADSTGGTNALQMSRLCSADLPAVTAFYNPVSGLGTTERIFMNGEEIGTEGRAFGHVATGANAGQSYQLPRLGRFSWENSVASPTASNSTVVMGLDDTTPGQVYMYVGTKTNAGSEVDRAGLTNGSLYGLTIPSLPAGPANNETRSTALGAAKGVAVAANFVNKGNVTGQTGVTIQANSEAQGVTEFLRPEDGAWDPNSPNDFYFVTTDRFNNPVPNEGRSRLYKITFDDATDPLLGSTVTMLLDGTEGQQMLDNLTIDKFGNVIMQEDPGNNAHLAKVWGYNIELGKLVQIGQHDPSRFVTGAPGFLTQDEESSGVTDATDIFDPTGSTGLAYAFLDVQAHYGNGPTLIEGGQLLVMTYNPYAIPEPGTALLLGAGLAGFGLLRRRSA